MTFAKALVGLLAEMRLRGYSPKTADSYADQLKRFGQWLDDSLAADLRRVSREAIDTYQRYVQTEPIGVETKALRLRAVKRLFDHLTASGQLLLHPAEHVVEIRRKDRLPRSVLTVKQVEQLLAAPDIGTPLGVRDRTLLEVLYGTGIRVGELEQVHVGDLDLGGCTLHIRCGKGDKARMVPLGKAACDLAAPLSRGCPAATRPAAAVRACAPPRANRPAARADPDPGNPARLPGALPPQEAGHAACPAPRLRDHLLQAGADIRLIQELLGHARLDSTAIYTRVAPTDLKAVHARYHPWEAADGAR